MMKRLTRRLFRRAGYDVVRVMPQLRFRLLREHGIDVVVDGGANEGQYGQSLRELGWSGLIVSIEPQREPFHRLARLGNEHPPWEVLRVAVAEAAGEAEMLVASNSGMSSSLLSPDERCLESAAFEITGTEIVQIARLDDLELLDGAVYLKLDLQGYELSALRGAPTLLERTRVVEAEVSLATLYEQQPLFPDVAAFMRDAGFALLEVEPGFRDRRTRDLLQMNAFFVRG